jgi:hypothetical protein
VPIKKLCTKIMQKKKMCPWQGNVVDEP